MKKKKQNPSFSKWMNTRFGPSWNICVGLTRRLPTHKELSEDWRCMTSRMTTEQVTSTSPNQNVQADNLARHTSMTPQNGQSPLVSTFCTRRDASPAVLRHDGTPHFKRHTNVSPRSRILVLNGTIPPPTPSPVLLRKCYMSKW